MTTELIAAVVVFVFVVIDDDDVFGLGNEREGSFSGYFFSTLSLRSFLTFLILFSLRLFKFFFAGQLYLCTVLVASNPANVVYTTFVLSLALFVLTPLLLSECLQLFGSIIACSFSLFLSTR